MKSKLLVVVSGAAALMSGYIQADDASSAPSVDMAKIKQNNKAIDDLNTDIEIKTRKVRLATLTAKLEELENASSGDNAEMEELKEEFDRKLSEMNANVEAQLQSLQSMAAKQNEPSVKVDKDILNFKDDEKTGVENIFVTGTNSIGSTWTAKVYYDNGIEELYEGDEVFPGAKIASIDMRGVNLKYNGETYRKRITSEDIAYARTFSNLQREEKIREQAVTTSGGESGGFSSPF